MNKGGVVSASGAVPHNVATTDDQGLVDGTRDSFADKRLAVFGIGALILLGLIFIGFYPGGPEQDSPYHFLMARAVWSEPNFVVQVWARPLYTALFALVAPFGLLSARLLSLGIGAAVAWQTWLLARDLDLPRPALVIPLLLAQPTFFELYPDVLTEPLFALVLVGALRLRLRGHTWRAILLASLLPLARPEGAFVCVLWAFWILSPQFVRPGALVRAMSAVLTLGFGMFLWWFAALLITHDPLYILHSWPSTWHTGMYGHGSLLGYAQRGWEFSGPLLVPFLLAGLCTRLKQRKWTPVTSSWLMLFTLHTLFWWRGWFGEAGYPRYMVCVAPATAVLTLSGLDTLAGYARRIPRFASIASFIIRPAVLLTGSIILSALYVDSLPTIRDMYAIREMEGWLARNPRPSPQVIWTNAYMGVNRHFESARTLSASDLAKNFALLKAAAPGTLLFWDDKLGPEWFGLSPAVVEGAGFRVLRVHNNSMLGYFSRINPLDSKKPSLLQIALLQKVDRPGRPDNYGTGDFAPQGPTTPLPNGDLPGGHPQ